MAEGDPGNPFGDNPFGGIPLFGDLAKALAGQGPLNWDAARQFAQMAASGGASEANVDPAVRIAMSNLARIAEMHVRDVTGLDPTFPEVTPVLRRVRGRSGRWTRTARCSPSWRHRSASGRCWRADRPAMPRARSTCRTAPTR